MSENRDPIDRWLDEQNQGLVEKLRGGLDIEAGLREALDTVTEPQANAAARQAKGTVLGAASHRAVATDRR